MPESLNKNTSIPLFDEAATVAFGTALSKSLTPGNIIFLEGDLGAGKTTSVRGILRGFGFSGAVKSPTYTLVEEYEFPWGMVYHFDLYRIKDPGELEFIGFREYVNEQAIILVEWAERGIGALPKPDVELLFSFANNQQNSIGQAQRVVMMKANNEKGEAIITDVLRCLKEFDFSEKNGNFP